jgi:hypothetical protein
VRQPPLDQQVGGCLGHPEQRVRRLVDRHIRVDSSVPAMIGWKFEARWQLLEWEEVGPVAIHLVCRGEHKRGIRRVLAGRLE